MLSPFQTIKGQIETFVIKTWEIITQNQRKPGKVLSELKGKLKYHSGVEFKYWFFRKRSQEKCQENQLILTLSNKD